MTSSDYDAFVAEFRRLSAALERYKQTPAEALAKADAYFHVLKQFPLALVTAKADAWLSKETKFPRPAEWANVIVRHAADVSMMSTEDAEEYARAERCGYEGPVCRCALCVEAGIEKPIRFVPETNADDTDRRVKDSLRNRVVVAGHWAHGFELARWYQARADFWNKCYELGLMTKPEKGKADRQPLMTRLEKLAEKLTEKVPMP